MASIKLGAIVVGIKGKVGGTVFRQSTTGAVLSNLPSGSNAKNLWGYINGGSPGPPGHLDPNFPWPVWPRLPGHRVRNPFATVSAQWRLLTHDQQFSWNSNAVNFPQKNKFGDTYTPSGFSVFMKLNLNRQMVNESLLTVCPAAPVIPMYPDAHFFAQPTGEISVFLVTPIPDTCVMQIFCSAPFSLGRQAGNGGYKLLFIGQNSDGNFVDIGYVYTYQFGLPTDSSRINMKWRLIDKATGVAGQWVYNKTNVGLYPNITLNLDLDVDSGPAGTPFDLTWTSNHGLKWQVTANDVVISTSYRGELMALATVTTEYIWTVWDPFGGEHIRTATFTVTV